MIDELLPVANRLYKKFEKEYGQQFVHPVKIARIIPNNDIFEQWQPNFLKAVKQGYIDPTIHTISFNQNQWRYFLILKAFWLDTVPLLTKQREKFIAQGCLTNKLLPYEKIQLTDEGVVIDNLLGEKIIFCEGPAGAKNPFFEYLPYRLNKGEVIDAQVKQYDFDHVLKKNIFILPKKNHWRIGSTYNREFTHEEVTQKAVNYFQQKMKAITGRPIEVLKHQAAVRPSTIDRRPFIGKHPVYERFWVFNGFGSKGVSLIPYFVKHFCDHLFNEENLLEEVDNQRFLTV